MNVGHPARPATIRREPLGRATGWVRPTARLALGPPVLLALALAVAPVLLLRLVVEGSADPPEALGVAVAFVVAAATAAMLADDAGFMLTPVAVSPARRALRRALVASATAGVTLVAVAAVARVAWPGKDSIDVAAGLALAVTAGVVTALVRPTGSRDAGTAALAGSLAAMALAATPVAVGGLEPVGRWIATAASWWSTDPGWWTLAVLCLAGAVLRRR
jgi:hypothetical protein